MFRSARLRLELYEVSISYHFQRLLAKFLFILWRPCALTITSQTHPPETMQAGFEHVRRLANDLLQLCDDVRWERVHDAPAELFRGLEEAAQALG